MEVNTGHCLFVVYSVALVFARSAAAEDQWSGLVNGFTEDFTYNCPDDLAVSGVASVFSDPDDDRSWEYRCSSGGGLANVTTNCSLEANINAQYGSIDFDCPAGGYVGGFQSTFSPTDRTWSVNCCMRQHATLVNCAIPTTIWENSLENVLNWTASGGRVLTGIQSFYSPFNRDRRWRFRQCEIQVSCGDPGIPANSMRSGDSFLYDDEVVFTCNNGYYQSSGPVGGVRRCLDTGLWSDSQPVCTQCRDIENCADIRCTSATDETCAECASNNGLALGESAYRNLNTSCLQLCSWLDGFCYPGRCFDELSSCNCSDGFTGKDCLNITVQPDLDGCTTTITYSTPSITKMGSCDLNSTSTIYVNSAPSTLMASWMTFFMGPSPQPTFPAYIDAFEVGVANTGVIGKLYRATSYPILPVSVTQHECMTPTVSPDMPGKSLISCDVTANAMSLSNHTFLHGDRFMVEVVSSSGGYLDVTNLDTNITSRNYYTGSQAVGFTLYVIDTELPTHCSVEPSVTCLPNQPFFSAMLATSGQVDLEWGGWVDDPSGVVKYRVELSRLEYDAAAKDLYEMTSLVNHADFMDSNELRYTTSFTLPNEGPYSFVLIVMDTAGNNQYARQIVIYDLSTSLLEDSSKPLVALSGVAENDAYWHNSTSSPIIISGTGHFYSFNLRLENWLAPVRNHTPPVPPEFDDDDRQGIPNALGVTDLSYAILVDQNGGQNGVNVPATFPEITSDIALNSVSISPAGISDGDSVTIWFEAQDFKSNRAQERVLVHIDSSPPLVSSLGLVVSGFDGQVLHATADLLDMNIKFRAWDMHSGLYNIEWSIQTDSGDLVGKGNVPVSSITRDLCLADSDCICDSLDHCHKMTHSVTTTSTDFPLGSQARHDTDYVITITAVNHARLSTSSSLKITVDLTPPLPGVVMESFLNQRDVDYQNGDTVPIHWNSFFDRETAIAFYQYAITTECLEASSFQNPLSSGSIAQQTMSTMVTWTASSPGTYFTTVVAYNGALQPSSPVCSDGITIDKEPPVFMGVVIPGGIVRPGLVRNADAVWLVYANRERVQVSSPTAQCVMKSTNITTPQLMTMSIRSSSVMVPSSACGQYPAYSTLVYTTVDTVLNISWSASDHVGIRGYKFGLSRSPNISEPIDILPLQTTAGHSHFTAHSPELVSGNEFYVHVVATDLAMQETTASVGPIVIDTSPPKLNGSLFIQQIEQLVMVWWEDDTFADEEDKVELEEPKYALDRRQYGTDVLDYTSLPSSPHSACPTPNCITIDTNTLQLIPGSQYHVSIRVRNSAGLQATFPVEPFRQNFPLSPCLSVFETDSNTLSLSSINTLGFLPQQEDKDVLFNNDILVGWSGLHDIYLNASFSVALGTQPGWSNIEPFTNVGSQNSYSFIDLSLTSGSLYYATVRAYNSLNHVVASSDGFVYLPTDASGGFVWDGLSEESDVDYTASTSVVSARWFFLPSLTLHVTHYRWGLFTIVDNNRSNLAEVIPYRNTGKENSVIMPVQLQPNTTYISAVQACVKHMCLEPIVSDGLEVTGPPSPGTAVAEYTAMVVDSTSGVSTRGILNISWSTFDDPDLSRYQWAVTTSQNAGYSLVSEWTEAAVDVRRVTIVLETPLSLHVNHWVTLMAINTAGLKTSTVTPLVFRGSPPPPLVVIDVEDESVVAVSASDWRQLEHHSPSYVDQEYTQSVRSLSAAWPALRYNTYNYSISTERAFQPCPNPSMATCGSTVANALTVSGLTLIDGQRYYFCIHALAEDYISPTNSPVGVTACSNGITVDRSPPKPACVQIIPPALPSNLPELTSGDHVESNFVPDQTQSCVNQSGYQASTSELRIVWDRFVDSEENRNVPHAYGVHHYEYAIGTSPGGEDIVGYTSLGVTNEIILTDLKLTPKVTYYATITAVDHVGLSSISSSQGITIDNTPPILSRIWLNTPTSFAATSLSQLRAQWNLVYDKESGVDTLFWGLGSAIGQSDLIQWRQLNATDTSVAMPTSLDIPDGQPVVLTLMAQNHAGLSVVSSSHPVIYDSTPPCAGRVFDGPKPSDGFLDTDYSTDYNRIQAHWEPFNDPHTGTTEYWWSIGTCPNCTDTMSFISVGLTTEAERQLPLRLGTRYFITVRGCSTYSGCATATSDGVTIDPSRPIASRVSHGLATYPIVQYQATRQTISGHWSGFHDAESSISHYTFYAGVAPDDDSYVAMTTLPADQQYFIAEAPFRAVAQLPINRTVHVTVVAVNKAGLATKAFSSGVFVTSTPPQLHGGVEIDLEWSGSLVPGTQYSSSALRVNWQYTDQYTVVDNHLWSLVGEPGIGLPLGKQTTGVQLSAVLTDIRLSSGDRYKVDVLGCNPTGLCTLSTSDTVLVDSSPPSDGYFAVQTNTAASLPWNISDGMRWRNVLGLSQAQLDITFTGFSDPHSNISSFWATIGSKFRGVDLLDSTASLSWQEHSNPNVYIAPVSLTRMLTPSETIHVSLWAVNGAGLSSRVALGSFAVQEDPNNAGHGHLSLLRSTQCQAFSCIGHCTCSREQTCPNLLNMTTNCLKMNEADLSPDMKLSVSNFVPQYSPLQPLTSPLFTAVSDQLVAMVTYETTTTAIQWVEWSVGLLNQDPGMGLLDTTSDSTWFPLLSSNQAIFQVSPVRPLQVGSTYVFHVRAWYNSTHYAVFQSSNGVTLDSKGLQVVKGRRVRETTLLAPYEADFTSSLSQLNVRWSSVFSKLFLDQHTEYLIGLGDTPGSDSAFKFTSVGNITTYNLTNLALSDNRRYYTSLQAVNPVGVVTTSISDGFLTDTTPPVLGIVTDGRWYRDETGQTSTISAAIRHFGFQDPNSQIHHYEAAITTSTSQPATTELTNIGIQLKTSLTNLTLSAGSNYHSHISAVNIAGVQSDTGSSNGFTVDISQPMAQRCTEYSPNLIQNGSFEMASCRPTSVLNDLYGWDSVANVQLLGMDSLAAYSGCHSLRLSAPIQQTFASSPGGEYALSLAMRAYSDGSVGPSRVQVSAARSTRVFTTYPSWDTNHWQVFELLFSASSSSTTIAISPAGGDIVVDDIQVINCTMLATTNRLQVLRSRQSPAFISSGLAEVSLNWWVTDEESGVHEYMWALGTVPGGEQVVQYSSSGSNSWAYSPPLSFTHNTTVYLSVVTTNNAGLSTVVHSDPLLVDLTAPELRGELKEGGGVEDQDYFNSSVVTLDWSAIMDEESGIQSCHWAIGRSPGSNDIQPFTTMAGQTQNSSDISSIVSHGTRLYSTVICSNQAGRSIRAVSDGVVFLESPPTSSAVTVTITSTTPTLYEPHNGYLPSDSLLVSWNGFVDSSGEPLQYEVRLGPSVGPPGMWTRVGGAKQLAISNITDSEGVEHTVEVRAYLMPGLTSNPVVRKFNISTTAPVENGGVPLNVNWLSTNRVRISWQGRFEDPSGVPLYYELSLGTQVGSASITRWQEPLETERTSFTFDDVRLVRMNEYFLSLTAIAYSGHSITINYMISNNMAVPISAV